MQKKFMYLASMVPAVLLCTQLVACTADGSIYGSQPWSPTNSSSVSSTTQKVAAKIHSAPLQPATNMAPTAPCNTLQLAGNTAQTPLTTTHKKRLAVTVPAARCQSAQSASGKIVLPVIVKEHNKLRHPGNIPTKSAIPGPVQSQLPASVPVQSQLPGASTAPTHIGASGKSEVPYHSTTPTRQELPGHSKTLNAPLNMAGPVVPRSAHFHRYHKNSIFADLAGVGSSIARSLFSMINRDRMAAGLPVLRWSNALVRSANQHNAMMATANQMAHQLPGEPSIGIREKLQGVNWTWCSENIAYNEDQTLDGATTIYDEMMAEQPPNDAHRQNILSPQGDRVGIDVLLDPVTQKMWMTEDFAGSR